MKYNYIITNKEYHTNRADNALARAPASSKGDGSLSPTDCATPDIAFTASLICFITKSRLCFVDATSGWLTKA